jgi:hypothetical protein
MMTFGSVSGAMMYWLFIASLGLLLAGGGLLARRRSARPVRPLHLAGAGITVLGFAALGYTGVWRSFYSLEPTESGVVLTYHWPLRRVLVPWDSVGTVDTAPGFRGNRPLRLVARDGRQHLSAMIPARDALRLSRCLSGEVARRRGSPAPNGDCT